MEQAVGIRVGALFGLLIVIVVGGVAGWLRPMLGVGRGGGLIGMILAVTAGAVIVLLLIRMTRRA